MSDDFIPLNQSTPIQSKWQQRRNQSGFRNNCQYNGQRHSSFHGNGNRWENSARSSFSSNASNNSFGQDRNNIDAYLHPAMLQDPWASLRQKSETNNRSKC